MGTTRDFPALGFDPAPGDAAAAQNMADVLTSSTNTVADAHDTAAGLHFGEAWTGKDADAAQGQIGTLGQNLGDKGATIKNAGAVLGQWADSLTGFQSKAGQLETQAQQAQQQLQTAQADPDLTLAGQTFTSAEAAQAAQQRYQGAVNGVRQAQQSLDGVKQQAQQLLQQHQQAANETANALNGKDSATALKHDSPPPANNGQPIPGQPIDLGQVTYNGQGSYNSGETAVSGYIDQALDAKGITDPVARQNWKNGLLTIASRESADNSPDWQVNTNDSNATGPNQSDGAPANCSRGGWQVIPSNFATYHQPGTSDDIYDPVANSAAAINYIQQVYHVSDDGSNLAAQVQQADPNRSPQGY